MWKLLKSLFSSNFELDSTTVKNEKTEPSSKAAEVAKFNWNAKLISSMKKKELDAYALENGIKLDGRKTKKDMIAQFKSALKEEGRM